MTRPSTCLLSALLILLSCSLSSAFVVQTPSSPRLSSFSQSASVSDNVDIDSQISTCKELLVKAAETKQEDSEIVIQALLDLEKLQRQKAKQEGESVGLEMKSQLNGDWQLIFTTGTATTQEKYGKINYFPIKAVQTFRTIDQDPMEITNGIFVGDFPLLNLLHQSVEV